MFFLNRFILRQEARPHSFLVLFLLSLFIGPGRAIQEHLFFGEKISLPMAFMMTYFYFCFGLLLTAILTRLTAEYWKRVANAVHVGIFLGLFPPLIDWLFVGFDSSIRYSFYLLWNFSELPWGFYSSKYNVPLGECITIWLGIFFSAYYTAFKTKSILRTIWAIILAYFCFWLIFAGIPMVTTLIFLGPITSLEMMQSAKGHAANFSIMIYPFWYLGLAIVAYLSLKISLCLRLLLRMLHTVPFFLVCLWGAQVHRGQFDGRAVLSAVAISLVLMGALVQNDYYDRLEDAIRKQHKVDKADVVFFYLAILMFLFWLFILGIKATLPLVLIFMLTVLYHHPQYRAKRYAWAALKIEAAWGGLAFLTGVFVYDDLKIESATTLTMLALAGGWSVVAAWKDLKDVRGDYRGGVVTLYLYCMSRGMSLKKTHQLISGIIFVVFLVPAVLAALKNDYLASCVLGSIAIILYLSSFYTGRGLDKTFWFLRQLLGIVLYFVAILVLGVTL